MLWLFFQELETQRCKIKTCKKKAKYTSPRTHLHLIVLVFSVSLLIHAAKEVDAVRADEVNGTLTLLF